MSRGICSMSPILFEWHGPVQPMKLLPSKDGAGWVLGLPMTFLLQCDACRARSVIPFGAEVEKIDDPRLMRARLVREYVRMLRSGSGYAAQVAYVGSLRFDGLKPSFWDLLKLRWLRMLS